MALNFEEQASKDSTLLESEDVDEPKLTYERILNDLARITRTDSITSSCLHNKFLAIGTFCGRIHILDHQGNKVDRQELCLHLKSVSSISIDEKGEYFVSCSKDKLVVYGLFNSEHNFAQLLDRPMNVVSIDPQFHRGGRRFVTGDDKVVLYEKGILVKYKTTLLQHKEQRVRTLSWHGHFIAWATDVAVQIYDLEQRKVITRIKRDTDSDPKDCCQFCWKDKRTLLVGWENTVKICLIKERSHEVLNETQLGKELPKKYVEIVSMFETDFTICGLAPFNNSLLTLSMNRPRQGRVRRFSGDTQSSFDSTLTQPSTSNYSIRSGSESPLPTDILFRPQVHIIETFSNSYNEISKDVLTPNGCLTDQNIKNFSYNLLSLHSEGIYFIVCPKDVISAKPRDYDDHIDWLMQHSTLKECFSFAKEFSNELHRHSVREIEGLYMNELLETGIPENYQEAARICSSICGKDLEAWNAAIKKFANMEQLKHLLPYLPKNADGFHLETSSYSFVLNNFLDKDSVSFFKAIKEIPSQLYPLESYTKQLLERLSNGRKDLVLTEALAELHTRMGEFEEAVKIYLEHDDKTRIFSLIRNNNLITILKDRVVKLMEIDADETSQLLVENIEFIPMKDVVERLERYKSKPYLVAYLHRLVMKDPDSCVEYHDLMVKLYAQHQRRSLLNFLKLSTNYRLEEALKVCMEANLIKEVVFLYSRMGDLREALKYITESRGDINEAIEFCKEHQDPELWQDLISYSITIPEFLVPLLKNVGKYMDDPSELVDRIPNNLEIENLTGALATLLQDCELRKEIERSRRDLMAKDCLNLLEKQIDIQSRCIEVKVDQICHHCQQPIITDSADSTSYTVSNQARSPEAGVESRSVFARANDPGDLIVFGCWHVFHAECCLNSSPTIDTDELSNHLTCRVCMLEKDNENVIG